MSRLDATLRRSAPLFAALGDETRLALMARIGSSGQLSIAALTEGTEISRQAVSKHLGVLERAGLVRASKTGRERHYEVKSAQLDELRRCLDVIHRHWDDALTRLKKHVEE
ncbi:MAG: metalloregulator ArsR/SmtB family transcription factor [Polyangiales bacterium]